MRQPAIILGPHVSKAENKSGAEQAAPNNQTAKHMRARLLSGLCDAWEVGPRSAAGSSRRRLRTSSELGPLGGAVARRPVAKAHFAECTDWCWSQAEAM